MDNPNHCPKLMSQVPESLLERAQALGVNLHPQPAERIVITGYAQYTPLGNTEQTWRGYLDRRSGVRRFRPGEDAFVDIAAPIDFNPLKYFSKKELQHGLSPLNALAIVISREAAMKATLIDSAGKLHPQVDRNMVGSSIGSGIGSVQHLIDIYIKLRESKDDVVNPKFNSRFVSPFKSLEIFPEELNSAVARALGISGWGSSSVEACATGLSNQVDAAQRIKDGVLKAAVAGGLDDPFEGHPDVGRAVFSSMREVLSKRNNNPRAASRPFDIDRDGFVEGAGGGVVVMEELEFALSHGVPILAEVLGFSKSMDGKPSQTDLDPDTVARTILQACWDEKRQQFHRIDAIFAHATSTKEGDKMEAEALRRAFGEKLREIPITAIKSYFGHLLGGAGAVNTIAAVCALNKGVIPKILNLKTPDPVFADLNFVRRRRVKPAENVLVLAYGFGGNDAVMVVGVPRRYAV